MLQSQICFDDRTCEFVGRSLHTTQDLIDELGMTITFARPCADINAIKRHLSHATMGAREMKNLDTMFGRMSDRAPSNARLFWQSEEIKTKFGVDTTSYKRLYL
jgi:hypothetical protein